MRPPAQRCDHRLNRALGAVRGRVEKIFGRWKRNLGYRRARYVGWARNHLELELKCLAGNLRRWVTVRPA